MKSESEFIAGVYEKYEKAKRETETKAARLKLMSRLGAFAACACVVLVISINVVPLLKKGGIETAKKSADKAEAETLKENAYLYTEKTEVGIVEFSLDEENDGMPRTNPTSGADCEAAQTPGEKRIYDDTFDSFDGNYHTVITEPFEYIMVSGLDSRDTDFGCEYKASGVTVARVYINAFADYRIISEENAENGAVFGECENDGTAYNYVKYERGKDSIIMILSTELGIDTETAADSVTYIG